MSATLRISNVFGVGIKGFLVLLNGCAAVVGQTNNPLPSGDWVLRSYQTKDGLPQNTVYTILQTRDGFLWIGTAGGLARFDGSRFRTFGLADGLPSVEISSLVEDREDALWVGTAGGGLSRWKNGRFTNFLRTSGFPAAYVDTMAADRDGSLWIGTRQGLFHYQNGVFSRVGPAKGLPQRPIRALLQDAKGTLWVSLQQENLYRGTEGYFIPVQGPDPHPEDVYELFQDQQGDVWAGTAGSIWQLHAGAWKRYGTTNGLPGSGSESFAQLKGGAMLAGVRHTGLYSFTGNGFKPFPESFDWSGCDIRSLITARDGSVWIGTETTGLCRLVPKSINMWGEANGLGQLNVRSVAQDSRGSLWVATQHGGIYRLENDRFIEVADPAFAKTLNCFTSLATVDGSVWVAGDSFLYRFRDGQPTHDFLKSPIKNEKIRAMCEDGEAVWLGTSTPALLKVVGDKVQVVETNRILGLGITCLALESKDTLWVGTSSGLFRWKQGKIKHWTASNGLLCSNIRSLLRESDGTLWIGTLGGGLWRLKEGRFINITTRQGLADDVISQIVSDDFGRLWLGCNHGIMRLDKSEIDDFAAGKTSSVSVAVMGENDGMIREQCTGGQSPSAIKTSSGHLLFPTVDGLAEVDPKRWQEASTVPPQVTIDEIKVDGEPLSPFSKVVIPPGGHHVELFYAAPNLRRSSSTRFRLRLDPLDKDWVNSGSRRTAYYADLPHGDYVFQVTASADQCGWNKKPATLAITVQPEFWQTWWFLLSVVALAGGIAFAWYLRRTAELEARHAAQVEFTRQLIQSQENERKRLASELHDGLGQDLLLIRNRAKMLAADRMQSSKVAQQLSEISTHAARAIADVRTISHGLRPTALEQVGFTKAVEWMIEQNAYASKTKFLTELENVDGMVAPEMEINMYRVLQEALNNVIKHAQASQVIVEIKRKTQEISISIYDNGKGFETDFHERDSRAQLSFGLAGMRERAKVLHGSIDLQSRPGIGTRLTLRVPSDQFGK